MYGARVMGRACDAMSCVFSGACVQGVIGAWHVVLKRAHAMRDEIGSDLQRKKDAWVCLWWTRLRGGEYFGDFGPSIGG